jgi:hypothetical protein
MRLHLPAAPAFRSEACRSSIIIFALHLPPRRRWVRRGIATTMHIEDEPMLPVLLSVLVAAALVFGAVGCSRGYKLGASITSRDLTNALPEWVFVLPTGATNLYLEHTPNPLVVRTFYKVSVPVSSLTNFLRGFGFSDEFEWLPTSILALMKQRPTLPRLGPRGMDAFLANAPREAHHASEWNPHKAKAPLRMYIKNQAAVSPTEQVMMLAFVDDSGSEQAIVYLDYLRTPLLDR